MSAKKVFVDSDVVISSIISEKGAAHLLLNEPKSNFMISNFSKIELGKVVDRLNLRGEELQNLIKQRLKTVKVKGNLERIKKDFGDYTLDSNDAHIIAGAVKAKAKFLLTYNVRHFRKQKINADLGIIVLTPAQYLQYSRSLG